MDKSVLKELIREEIRDIRQEKRLNEALDKKDYQEIKDIVRSEVAAIMFDLFKKRQIWV